MKAARYDYPLDDGYADTVATLDDGRVVWINTQYGRCDVRHADGCDMLRWGAVYVDPPRRCTCGAELPLEMQSELLRDARVNGKFGRPPEPVETEEAKAQRLAGLALYEQHGPGWCDKCGSYCHGDCEASR